MAEFDDCEQQSQVKDENGEHATGVRRMLLVAIDVEDWHGSSKHVESLDEDR